MQPDEPWVDFQGRPAKNFYSLWRDPLVIMCLIGLAFSVAILIAICVRPPSEHSSTHSKSDRLVPGQLILDKTKKIEI